MLIKDTRKQKTKFVFANEEGQEIKIVDIGLKGIEKANAARIRYVKINIFIYIMLCLMIFLGFFLAIFCFLFNMDPKLETFITLGYVCMGTVYIIIILNDPTTFVYFLDKLNRDIEYEKMQELKELERFRKIVWKINKNELTVDNVKVRMIYYKGDSGYAYIEITWIIDSAKRGFVKCKGIRSHIKSRTGEEFPLEEHPDILIGNYCIYIYNDKTNSLAK